ncbi:hypothetical protein C8R45DRAFT_1075603 [Mycena sanguinolenta]|nr:hypothetical protein C8R45DRAFT_1075603 [Mycena sanguinolenta]
MDLRKPKLLRHDICLIDFVSLQLSSPQGIFVRAWLLPPFTIKLIRGSRETLTVVTIEFASAARFGYPAEGKRFPNHFTSGASWIERQAKLFHGDPVSPYKLACWAESPDKHRLRAHQTTTHTMHLNFLKAFAVVAAFFAAGAAAQCGCQGPNTACNLNSECCSNECVNRGVSGFNEASKGGVVGISDVMWWICGGEKMGEKQKYITWRWGLYRGDGGASVYRRLLDIIVVYLTFQGRAEGCLDGNSDRQSWRPTLTAAMFPLQIQENIGETGARRDLHVFQPPYHFGSRRNVTQLADKSRLAERRISQTRIKIFKLLELEANFLIDYFSLQRISFFPSASGGYVEIWIQHRYIEIYGCLPPSAGQPAHIGPYRAALTAAISPSLEQGLEPNLIRVDAGYIVYGCEMRVKIERFQKGN